MPQAGSYGRLGRTGGRLLRRGPRWVPEAATPEAGPGSLARRPARPQSPKSHWEAWVGEARSGEARLEGQVFAAVGKADEGRERGEEGDPLMEQAFG